MSSEFGGKIRFTYDKNPLVLRGKMDHEPVDEERDVVDNQDGSFAITRKPKKERVEVTFEDSDDAEVTQSATGIDWKSVVKGGPYNVTFVEEDTGAMHTYSKAKFFGRPKVDRTTGEVTGLSIVGTYKRTTA